MNRVEWLICELEKHSFLSHTGLERVMENTREICLTTHADPRCLASCVAVTTAVRSLLSNNYGESEVLFP